MAGFSIMSLVIPWQVLCMISEAMTAKLRHTLGRRRLPWRIDNFTMYILTVTHIVDRKLSKQLEHEGADPTGQRQQMPKYRHWSVEHTYSEEHPPAIL